jgi:hypothetical protein
VTRLIICPDTIGLKATLERLSAAGNREALRGLGIHGYRSSTTGVENLLHASRL